MDAEEFGREEGHVIVVILSATMIGPTRERVWLAHAGPRLVLQREVEAGEVDRPSRLSAIELLCNSKVFEVLVVSEDLNRMARPLKVVAPFLETSDYCQHFHVVDLIVAFDRTERLGQERHWVPLAVFARLLRENRTSCDSGSIGFQGIGEIAVGECEDGSGRDKTFEHHEGVFLGRTPDEPNVLHGEIEQGVSVLQKVRNESSVEVDKPDEGWGPFFFR